jgi:hypothetical protein
VTELTIQPAGPPRTWRPVVLWTAGILLALGLAWFVGAVVVPVWRVRETLSGMSEGRLGVTEAIDRLGGPRLAAKLLTHYMRLPLTSDSRGLVVLLLACSLPEGTEIIADNLNSGPVKMRRCLAQSLNVVVEEEQEDSFGRVISVREWRPEATVVLPALERALKDGDAHVRAAAVSALKNIRGQEPPK